MYSGYMAYVDRSHDVLRVLEDGSTTVDDLIRCRKVFLFWQMFAQDFGEVVLFRKKCLDKVDAKPTYFIPDKCSKIMICRV